ncbi:unnamed protein product [Peniophora sp. CBMAI 1063]|nr:unnamed protein product [Peniophora sp. CBMAI 1063]
MGASYRAKKRARHARRVQLERTARDREPTLEADDDSPSASSDDEDTEQPPRKHRRREGAPVAVHAPPDEIRVANDERDAALAHVGALSTQLSVQGAASRAHEEELSECREHVTRMEAECARLRARETRLKRDKCTIRVEATKAAARAAEMAAQATKELSLRLQKAIESETSTQKERDSLSARLAVATEDLARKDALIASARKRAKAHYMRARRAGARAKANSTTLKRMKSQLSGQWLTNPRGAYSFKARELVRALETCGCAPARIGTVLERIAEAYGGKVPRKISRRSVGRIKMEGGLMAKVQLAFEIAQAKERKRGLTLSDDCTSLGGISHMARHITLEVPSYEPGADPSAYTHKTRVVDVSALFNHTILTQLGSWEKLDEELERILRPIAAEIGVEYCSEDLWRVVRGKMADHAADGQGLGRECEEKRMMVVKKDLGLAVLSRISDEDVEKMIADRRPLPADFTIGWEEVAHLHLALHLGADAFDGLSPEERKQHELFIIAGCGSHKVMNADSSFCDGMSDGYDSPVVFVFAMPKPCLLPNAANRAAIDADVPGGSAAKQAIAESKHGGVKFCGLLGALCNNKDDKRGYQDFHRWFFELIKFEKWGECTSVKFPGTSHIRYQSYLLAAVEVIKLPPEYRRFLELARDRKGDPRMTNIEHNVYTALNDPATITELACMALYYMLISAPAMRAIRGRGRRGSDGQRTKPRLNYADCGPIYDEILMHLDHVIYNATTLFCSPGLATRGKQCVLFGDKWEDQHAIEAIAQVIPSLPAFRHLLVQGLLKARSCWDRFTEKFAGGLQLDAMTSSERLLCYIPAENDDNESLLGQIRKFIRLNPNASARTFSDGVTYAQNDTEAFARRYLSTDTIQQYIMQLARKQDARGDAKKFRRALLEHEAKKAQATRDKQLHRATVARKKRDHIDTIIPLLDKDAVAADGMTKAKLVDQLNWHKVIREDKDVPALSKYNKADLQRLLIEALGRMQLSASTSQIAAAFPGSSPLATSSMIGAFAATSTTLQSVITKAGFAVDRLPVEYDTEDEA